MKFRIGKFNVEVELSPKGTVWWIQLPENKNHPQQRIDALFALERIFVRKMRVYVYCLRIGRLSAIFVDRNQIPRM
jgi:hypothetical protein